MKIGSGMVIEMGAEQLVQALACLIIRNYKKTSLVFHKNRKRTFFNLKTAVGPRKKVQDFDPEPLDAGVEHSQKGLFHLFGQNFGQTRGPRCCNFRRGNSASYFRGERCDRWGLAVGRKLTEKVKKAPTRYFMQNITRWMPKDCANRPQISCKLGLEQVPGQCWDRPGCIHAFATINDSPFFSRIFI